MPQINRYNSTFRWPLAAAWILSTAKLPYVCDTNRKTCQEITPIYVLVINMLTEKSVIRAQGGHAINQKVSYLANANSNLRQQSQRYINYWVVIWWLTLFKFSNP